MPVSLAQSTPPSFTAELEKIMRSHIRPISLLLTPLFLSLIFTNPAWAFECTNAGAGATAPDDGDIAARTACGDAAQASGFESTALGGSATASGSSSIAVGGGATASGSEGVAVGQSATASGSFSTAVGGSATASGSDGTTAVGLLATASGSFSIAVGANATASGSDSTAVGWGAMASGDNNTALGFLAAPLGPHTNATALGFRAQVEQSNAMVLGSIPGINEALNYVDVGIGTTMPQAPLHVERVDGTARVRVTELQAGPSMPFQGEAMGLVRFELNDEASGERWRFTNAGSKFAINNVGVDSPGTEMSVFKNGDMTIGGVLTENSDVNAKRDFEPLDAQDVLAKIADLEVVEWSYIDAPQQRHVGPMAQDFHAAFGLGRDNTHIATLDTSGIALAGIQALVEDNAAIRAQNEALLQHNAELSERLAALEQQQAQTQTIMARVLEAQLAQPVLTRSLAN
jgi:hypothetical protein